MTIRTPQQVLDNLKKLQEIYKQDARWIKHASKNHQTIDDVPTICYCLTGGLGAVVHNDPYSGDIYPELKALGFAGIDVAQNWNDHSKRTISEIRNRLATGINELEQQIGATVHTPISITASPADLQAAAVATTAAAPTAKAPKAPKAAGPGIRKYPKGHDLAGQFVPATVTADEFKAIVEEANAPKPEPVHETITAYKGFNVNPDTGAISCRAFTFEVGRLHEVPDNRPVEQCRHGFHACQNPFDIFAHYSLIPNHVFGKVTLHAPFAKGNAKIAAKGITVDEVMSWPHFMNALAKFARENPDEEYVRNWVTFNSQKAEDSELFNIQAGVQAETATQNGTATQMSDIRYAVQNGSASQFAFGDFSQQNGTNWQVSHAQGVTVNNSGRHGRVEVYGKGGLVNLTSVYSKVKGVTGTRIAVTDAANQFAFVGVIGKNGLEPNKWIGLKTEYVPGHNKQSFANI